MSARSPTLLQRLAPRRPVGAFRGSLIGFLLGVTLTGTYGAAHLLVSYKTAAGELEATVTELRNSSAQITGYLKRLDQVEASVRQVQGHAATRDHIDQLRTGLKHSTESQALEVLDLKSHIWNLEQEVAELRKRDATMLRLTRLGVVSSSCHPCPYVSDEEQASFGFNDWTCKIF